ncbi:DNA polymerase III subunit gamma/tau [Parahalioglobus pacificus]|uniref:DNA polymerase III subunit gamma/tau n=1 Tax=Parahalioglobus pacificus TaxID=930806 RepID=A0A918XG00_9GAMM|nr:DNA polymerase III subunit gamma/tau [Halioglobus pacificus]NQY04235.1 DNA polymerase III subunit gamma/tau [Halieaceae bacterium]GHD30285.1 hypothetical protein GCM10007053_11900 [Halioglobus pacificus]
MSYQVLARKWRPSTFREMVGQEHVLQALINALDHDRLHHAYLFTGTRGVGKTTVARILAKCLNCDTGVSSEPCGTCASCLEIAEGRCVDLIEVDAASKTKVDDTRELLENVQYAPTRARYKVYLIDEVHMLSTHSFNALLKTLEEPPPHVKFLLATTDPQKLPATILSRCLQFNLKNMLPEQIVAHLAHVLSEEMISYEDQALWLLGRAAAGSMRDALSLTDQAIAFGSGQLTEADVGTMLGTVDLRFVYQILEAVAADQPGELLQVVSQMSEHAPDFEGSLNELINLLHRVAVAQLVPDAVDNGWGDAERVTSLAATFSADDVQLLYQVAINGKRDLPMAGDPRSGFEMILLRMIAFRPQAVIDTEMNEGDFSLAADNTNIAGEVGADAAKKQYPLPDSGSASPKSLVAEAELTPSRAAVTRASSSIRVDEPQLETGRTTQSAHSLDPATSGGTSAAPGPNPGDSAPLQPAVGRLSDLAPGGWAQALEQLGLAGIVHNVASHCELRRIEGTELEFVLDQDNATLFNDGHRDKIRLALENFYGQPLTVTIAVAAVMSETPAARRQRLIEERQHQAVSAIQQDALLQQLMQHFDGELDMDSIRPLDT